MRKKALRFVRKKFSQNLGQGKQRTQQKKKAGRSEKNRHFYKKKKSGDQSGKHKGNQGQRLTQGERKKRGNIGGGGERLSRENFNAKAMGGTGVGREKQAKKKNGASLRPRNLKGEEGPNSGQKRGLWDTFGGVGNIYKTDSKMVEKKKNRGIIDG